MDAPDAKTKTRQKNESQVADDEFSDARETDIVACSKRERFASQQQQRSIEYEEIVASCVSYTLSSPLDQEQPIRDGDIVQIISLWSTVNDGVVQIRDNKVSAEGVIIKNDKAGNGAGNQSDKTEGGNCLTCFQCCGATSGAIDAPKPFILIPCEIGGYDKAFKQFDVLSTYTKDEEWKLIIESSNDTAQNKHMEWYIERATKDSKDSESSNGSVSRDWRLCVQLDENDKSKYLYLAASRNGALSLCHDDTCDDNNPCTDKDSFRNPQTYFYLYKKGHNRPLPLNN